MPKQPMQQSCETCGALPFSDSLLLNANSRGFQTQLGVISAQA
jgi:hypothetical protein